ncbi:hypothetical protein NQP46_12455 [Streptomyces albus]|nr:hypothetical protein NQP46_12455 [Streptomyces albus]
MREAELSSWPKAARVETAVGAEPTRVAGTPLTVGRSGSATRRTYGSPSSDGDRPNVSAWTVPSWRWSAPTGSRTPARWKSPSTTRTSPTGSAASTVPACGWSAFRLVR